MSLTIRMRRALAAFRADPYKPLVSVTVPQGGSVRTVSYGGGGVGVGSTNHGFVSYVTNGRPQMEVDVTVEDSPDWVIVTAWHKYRIIDGKRLDFFVNGKGIQKIQYDGRMYYGVDCKRLLSKLGLK